MKLTPRSSNSSNRSRRAALAPARPTIEMLPLEPRRLFAAGNILVGVSNDQNVYNIIQYTQDGVASPTPVYAPTGNDNGADKDFVVAPNGDLLVYRNDSVEIVRSGMVVQTLTTAGLNLIGRTFYGGLDANSRYIFVADMSDGGDTAPGQTGIVRFDMQNNYAVMRFATDSSIEDVTVGQDGLVYGLADPGGQPEQSTVKVYDPETTQLIRQFQTPGVDASGVAADADGNVYLGSFDSGIYKTSSTGTVLVHNDQIGGTDLDLSNDGKLLVAGGGRVTVVDTNLQQLSSFTTGTVFGSTFAAWATSQAPLPPDTSAPMASATLGPLLTSATSYAVTVHYTDDRGINLQSVGNGDLVLTGGSVNETASLVSKVADSNGGATAIYLFTAAPAGTTYTVSVASRQVLDGAGNAVAAAPLGTVTPTSPTPTPTPTPSPSPTPTPTPTPTPSPSPTPTPTPAPSPTPTPTPSPTPTPTPTPPENPPPPSITEPDLTAHAISIPPSAVTPATKGRIVVQLNNATSIAEHGAAMDIAVYASTDDTFDPATDTLIGDIHKRVPIAGRSSRNVRVPVNFSSLSEGSYQLLLDVDAKNAVAENDEGNNITAIPGTVSVAVPFVDLGPATVGSGGAGGPILGAGKSETITTTLLNAGSKPVKGLLDVALSALPEGGGAAIPLQTVGVKVSFKKPGVPRSVRLVVTVPSTLPQGLYHLQATLDPNNKLGDVRAENNTFDTGATIDI